MMKQGLEGAAATADEGAEIKEGGEISRYRRLRDASVGQETLLPRRLSMFVDFVVTIQAVQR